MEHGIPTTSGNGAKKSNIEVVQQEVALSPKDKIKKLEDFRNPAIKIVNGILKGSYTDDVEDIVQEAYIKAVKNLKNFNHLSALETWFYRILVNMTLDFLRKQKKFDRGNNGLRVNSNFDAEKNNEEMRQIPSLNASPEDLAIRNQEISLAKKALNGLPEKMREVIILGVMEDMTRDI